MADVRGRIEVICGPMFAGKTSELLKRLAGARASGQRVCAIQPAGDTRSGPGRLKTHAGQVFAATAIGEAQELIAAAGDSQVVGIDEMHFFAASLAEECRRLAGSGKRVIAAGIDWDHLGRLFPASEALLAVADERTVLTAICARCGAAAEYTQRLVESEAAIVVGGAESYEPRCAKCFKPASIRRN